ncbi:MAG: P-loop NTPase [Oscillospiraceae bacterium]|nr:P-loop NTPase [Oscillospiraceae bacterium]
MGQVIFSISGKGGTGKTTVGSGVASCLGILGHKTLLIDTDCGLRNVDIIMGVSDKAVMHLGDALSDNVAWEDAPIVHPDIPNLSIIAAPSSEDEMDIEKFGVLIGKYKEKFDFIWIDGSAGLGERHLAIAEIAELVVVVVTPDVVSMRDAARVSELLNQRAFLVVNRVRPRLVAFRGALYVDDIMDATGIPLLGVVPEDERVIAATNKGVPLVLLSQDGAAEAYRDIALRLLGERVPQSDMKVTSKAKRAFLSGIE